MRARTRKCQPNSGKSTQRLRQRQWCAIFWNETTRLKALQLKQWLVVLCSYVCMCLLFTHKFRCLHFIKSTTEISFRFIALSYCTRLIVISRYTVAYIHASDETRINKYLIHAVGIKCTLDSVIQILNFVCSKKYIVSDAIVYKNSICLEHRI